MKPLLWDRYSYFELLLLHDPYTCGKKITYESEDKFLVPLPRSILSLKGPQEACLNTNLSPREIQWIAFPYIYYNKEIYS